MTQLTDKVLLLMGASRGIEATIAQAAARAGARVVVNYVGSPADAVVAAIAQAGGQALALQADVSQAADGRRPFADAIAHFGRVAVLVHHAGIMLPTPLQDTTDEAWQRTLAVNLTGVLSTLREAATPLAGAATEVPFLVLALLVLYLGHPLGAR